MKQMVPEGYDRDMRFKMGLVMGFGAGYYLGAMAGRERYEQINRTVDKLRGSETFEAATEKARDVVDQGSGRAKEFVEDKFGGGNEGEPSMADGMGTGAKPPWPSATSP